MTLTLLFVTAVFASMAAPAVDFPGVPGVPGVVIDHRPAETGIYLGSPSIAILSDGTYIASHDFFGPGADKKKIGITDVFRSTDMGQSWNKLTRIRGQAWGPLFTHNNALYIMGTDRGYGNIVIRKSLDNGKTWTEPKNESTGLLRTDAKYHTAPVPVVVHKNRIWRAMEDGMGPGGWGDHFRAFMLSAPADAELLNARSWTCSNRLGRDPKWLDGKFGGWLEGNAVVTPQGEIVNVLRVDYRPEGGKAAIINVSDDGQKISFDPNTGFIDFPGGCKKFTIRHDPRSDYYWTLSNAILPAHSGGNPERTRNAVALMRTADLRKWQIRCIVLYHPEVHKHGFQYLDWQFEGPDIIAASRTAYDDGLGGADNQHNANFFTFHRFKNFRELTLADSVEGAKPGEKAWQKPSKAGNGRS